MTDEQEYEGALPLLDAAATEIGRRIRAALPNLGDPLLVRSRVEPHRIKKVGSSWK